MKLLTRRKIRTEQRLSANLSDSAYIQGLSQSQIDSIEKDLTFHNPQYAQVKKYSKWATTRVPEFLTYFEHISDYSGEVVKVPLGYFNSEKFDLSDEDITDCREYSQIKFPKLQLELRETQEKAIEKYLFYNRDNNIFKSSIQLPTGKGKTVLGLALASILKAKTLIVVHKVDLVNGWLKDIKKCFDDKVGVGIIRAQSRKVGEHFTIATIQTLNRLSQKELNALYDTFGFVILDECHHVPSTTFSLVNNFKSRFRLGLSATPERNDGLTHIIQLYFGDFCYCYSKEQTGKQDKDILPFEVYKRNLPVYYEPICIQKRNGYALTELDRKECFNQDYVLKTGERRIRSVGYNERPNVSYLSIDSAVLKNKEVSTFIINDIMNSYDKGHSCLVLFKQIDVLLEYFRLLLDRGVSESDVGLYYGGNSKSDEVVEKAESKRKFITLATYSKASEGTNVQQWEVAFLVSSLNNGKDVEQSIGRIRRKKENGRKLSVTEVYDYRYPYVYALSNHGQSRDSRYRQMRTNSTSKFSRGF